jgi:hypothetical protein
MRDQYKGKSYNQVMNEWAAQRSFLQRASSRLLRPPAGARGASLLMGWIWRLIVFILIPLLLYAGWMRVHMKSGEWTSEIQRGTQRYLNAASVTAMRSRWDFNGELRIEKITARGGLTSPFADLEASTLSTWITIPAVFKKEWHLKNVDAFKATVSLRNGLPAATAAVEDASRPVLLTAGWGISPDFSLLSIDTYTCRDLTLRWGASPATSGEIRGTRARFTRRSDGWDTTLEGGTARQGWLDGLKLSALKVSCTGHAITFSNGALTLPGSGTGMLTGGLTLAEHPEIKASVSLENVALEAFLPDYLQRTIKAVCDGRVQLSGSTNRNSGVLLDADFTLKSGTLLSLPVLRALEIITQEPQLAQPGISGGHIRFTSAGSGESGGIAIEGKDILIECGSLLRVSATFRHERKPVLASSIKDTAPGQASAATETTYTLRLGLAPGAAAKLNAAIRTEFGVHEEQGFHWMDIPFVKDEITATQSAADRLSQLHNGGK